MKPIFPVGLSSYALRWSVQWQRTTAEGVLRQAAAAGAQVVQLCDNLEPEARPEHELRQLAALAEQLGLTLELGMTGCTPAHLRQCLRAAGFLNARSLRTVIGSGVGLAAVEQTIRGSLAELRERGISLAIENHFDLPPRDLRTLVETLGSPLVGVCLDLFNAVFHLASQAETRECLAPYALSIHVKDVNICRRDTGFYIYGCRLGEGRLDLDALLRAVRRTGNTPALFVESWMDRCESEAATCAQEEAWLRDGIQFLKQKTMEEVHQ